MPLLIGIDLAVINGDIKWHVPTRALRPRTILVGHHSSSSTPGLPRSHPGRMLEFRGTLTFAQANFNFFELQKLCTGRQNLEKSNYFCDSFFGKF